MFLFLDFQECIIVWYPWFILVCIVLCHLTNDVQILLITYNASANLVTELIALVATWTSFLGIRILLCVSRASLRTLWDVNLFGFRLYVEVSFYILVLADKHHWRHPIVIAFP